MNAASMGTIGVVTGAGTRKLDHTTPDPIALHRLLADLAKDGIDHLSLEASSHGLDQHRLDGVDLARCCLHQHHPRPSRLSSELRSLSRHQAAPVPRRGAQGRRGRHQCRCALCRRVRRCGAGSRTEACDGRFDRRDAYADLARAPMRMAKACWSIAAMSVTTWRCRSPARSRRRMCWSRPASPSHWASPPTASSRHFPI